MLSNERIRELATQIVVDYFAETMSMGQCIERIIRLAVAETVEACKAELAAADEANAKLRAEVVRITGECNDLREKLRIEEFYDDVSPGCVCTVCGGKTRYGERHSRCGSAVIEKEREAATLRAELKRLTIESDVWSRDAERYCSNADYHYGEAKKVAQERNALRAEVERLREDAERYRWLASRARKDTAYDRYGNGAQWIIGFFADDGYHALDAAIDAARKESK